MNCESTYYEIFSTQFFTTLGQLTAGVVSAAILVPMYEFYTPKIISLIKPKVE